MQGRVLLVAGALVSLAAPVPAEEEASAFVFATYFRCDETKEQRADAIHKETVAPLFQKEVEAGRLTTHGWSRHWAGGAWRRLGYIIGTDLDKVVDARNNAIGALVEKHRAASDEFTAICSSHDDYIWRVVAASQPAAAAGTNRGKAGMSTYFECDVAVEDEADAIVKTAMAPILDAHVKEGKISSWVWIQHLVGGKYRRALVFDAADHKAVLHYWGGLVAALAEKHPTQARRFSEVCGSHTDYVWDLGTE